MKHLFREMTLYYGNGASYARKLFDIPKEHIANDLDALKPELDTLAYIKNVIFSDEKLFGLICDNKLFIKPTNSGRKFIGNVVEAPPYEGAKPSFLIEDKIEDSEWISELVRISLKELPTPKLKKKK